MGRPFISFVLWLVGWFCGSLIGLHFVNWPTGAFVGSFVRCFVRWFFRSLVRPISGNLGTLVGLAVAGFFGYLNWSWGWLVGWLVFVRLFFIHSLARSLPRWFLVGLFVRSFSICSLVPSFIRSLAVHFTPSCVLNLLLSCSYVRKLDRFLWIKFHDNLYTRICL